MKPQIRLIVYIILVMWLVSGFNSALVYAHEVWFLNPTEVLCLSMMAPPILFTSTGHFALIALPIAMLTLWGIFIEPKWWSIERRFFPVSNWDVKEISSIILCVGLAAMLLVAAFGLLPMMGQESGSTTLLVANGILSPTEVHTPFIFSLEIAFAVMLIIGFQVRLAALGVLALTIFGHFLFGLSFFDFSPHFAAPALLLLSFGRKTSPGWMQPQACLLQPLAKLLKPEACYAGARIITGAEFMYLAMKYKFLEPALTMSILEHSELFNVGVLNGPAVLVMGFFEFIAGFFLVFGVLVRPVAVFLMFAFTFFAFVLGESIFYHSQLYALALVFAVCGTCLKLPSESRLATGAKPEKNGGFQAGTNDEWGRGRVPVAGIFCAIIFVLCYSIPQMHRANASNLQLQEDPGCIHESRQLDAAEIGGLEGQ